MTRRSCDRVVGEGYLEQREEGKKEDDGYDERRGWPLYSSPCKRAKKVSREASVKACDQTYAVAKVDLNDNVVDGAEHELDLVGL